MPIINASAVDTYHVHELHIDMDEQTGDPVSLEIILARKVDGHLVSEPSYSMNALALQTWLDETPVTGLSRGEDMKRSLLTWVHSTGLVTGTVE